MDNRKFLFVGNRFYVLQEMIKLALPIVKIYAEKDSFLQKELEKRNICYALLPGKKEFFQDLQSMDFDIFISNGCPYIIPVGSLSSGGRKFINIHPSLLPDLKGRNPVNGALLLDRKHGVTCHYMDDGIDTGTVIEQMEIPLTDDVDLDLLYQISFRAEGRVFLKAYERRFRPGAVQPHGQEPVYYTRKDADRHISPEDSAEMLLRKVRAFGSEKQYAYFWKNNARIEVISASEIKNETALQLFRSGLHNVVKAVYGNRFVLAEFGGCLIQFQLGNTSFFEEGGIFIESQAGAGAYG